MVGNLWIQAIAVYVLELLPGVKMRKAATFTIYLSNIFWVLHRIIKRIQLSMCIKKGNIKRSSNGPYSVKPSKNAAFMIANQLGI